MGEDTGQLTISPYIAEDPIWAAITKPERARCQEQGGEGWVRFVGPLEAITLLAYAAHLAARKG